MRTRLSLCDCILVVPVNAVSNRILKAIET